MLDLPYCLPAAALYAEIRNAGFEVEHTGLREVPTIEWVGVWVNPETEAWYFSVLYLIDGENIACIEASGEKRNDEGNPP